MRKFKIPRIIVRKLDYDKFELYFTESKKTPGWTFVKDVNKAKVFHNTDPIMWDLMRLLPYYSYLRGISVKQKIGNQTAKITRF